MCRASGPISRRAWASPGIRTAKAARRFAPPTASSTIGPSSTTARTPARARPGAARSRFRNPPGGLTNPFAGYPGGNPFPGPIPPARNQAFPTAGAYFDIPLDLRPTYVQAWDLSYQRQVGANWLLLALLPGQQDDAPVGPDRRESGRLHSRDVQRQALLVDGESEPAPRALSAESGRRRLSIRPSP